MPDDDQAPSPENPHDDDLARRLDALGRDLDKRHPDPGSGPGGASSGSGKGYAQALRMSADFVAGVLVGAAIGWGFDAVLGTSPWGLVVFLLLGFAAGVLNVLRTAGLVSEPDVRKKEPTDGQTPRRPDDQ